MWIMDKETHLLITDYIVAHYTIRTLEVDREGFQRLKMGMVYEEELNQAILSIRERLRIIKQEFKQRDIRVYKKESDEYSVSYEAVCNQYVRQFQFMNEQLRMLVTQDIQKYLFRHGERNLRV
ncbi:hypothetical protein [Salsuginibacillus kocurii]|uniref:hypothetical protein n=1 Tax=Salsuginibacillus kocurii TaxID=427078 RepID=UPI000380C08E|nr:hypothetical protein [Salsuginibacillus kocurii]